MISRRAALAFVGAALAGSRWLSNRPAAADSGVIHRVEIRDFVFAPSRLEVSPGDRIIWINRDIVPHTATASDKSWDSGTLGTNEEWQMTLEAGMEADYFCRFHPMMKARLEIRQT